ncbi:sulfite exporter TauE/SafE family protein [Ruegeria pomeroyi]|nr:sulfite exporter TauE/SafE family protein [Ruegeria pomeroyi]MCE8520709.1 sulfite exporter TauE/SafE family protein [Ruegeria pomeroyi]MCE8524738.1 sulfite exporter TauE/SafE family protein [Ruegeria pomeroyi]MCE8528723.1 sulfite exporter TauE/SafE family protein [Ruegeria pomeroyi]MCE8532858.1 sulfite exporter TauE/SafE family protein [Ruegeria pomeroyi]
MLEPDIGFFAVTIPAVIFAGISKGGFGSGVAFASASILAIYLDPGQALALMLPLLMLIDLATLKPYWRRWSGPDARLLILGGLPGVALGALLYRATDADLLRLLIGGISLAFVAWQMARGRGWVREFTSRLPPMAGLLAGTVAGFTSFVSHAGGPPAAVYLLSQRLGKTEFQATTVLTFWALNIAKFIPYAWLGMFTLDTARAGLLLAPFALLGAWLGVKAHHLVPERAFFALAHVMLTLTGVKLIWDALG